MLRGVRDRQAGAIGQHLDAALTLGELFQKFEAMGVRQRFGHSGELHEQRVFGTAD